jgi:hypothetical protein
VSPVKYKLGFYFPENDILHSHCSENLKSYKYKVIAILEALVLVLLVEWIVN